MTLDVVREDEYLIAVNKRAGQPVAPCPGFTLEETLLHEIGSHIGRNPFAVHRLDRETSGLILFAKDSGTHRHLSMAFERRMVRKTYLAVVCGLVTGEGEIDGPIREFGSGRMGVHRAGKAALTRYAPIERFAESTLLQVVPETGRRHQIRVHLYHVGHPVLGDPLYGIERPVGGAARLMLHACRLEFAHPSGTLIMLAAEPGDDWRRVIGTLGAIDSRTI